jgi:hypothetical protein
VAGDGRPLPQLEHRRLPLRERLGAAVVRLLALGFAYSLWVLALLEVFNFRPYASAALALASSTAAVLSLISYRQLGRLGYQRLRHLLDHRPQQIRVSVFELLAQPARHIHRVLDHRAPPRAEEPRSVPSVA